MYFILRHSICCWCCWPRLIGKPRESDEQNNNVKKTNRFTIEVEANSRNRIVSTEFFCGISCGRFSSNLSTSYLFTFYRWFRIGGRARVPCFRRASFRRNSGDESMQNSYQNQVHMFCPLLFIERIAADKPINLCIRRLLYDKSTTQWWPMLGLNEFKMAKQLW